jgi:deoxyuridine 5'-triphosphate nucleotidohydrolase
MFLKYHLMRDGNGNVGFAPQVMTHDAACADLRLPDDIRILGHEHVTIPLLIGFDIPVDWCLYLQPRSSTFTRHGLLSTTGIIDSDYHGSVHAQLYNMDDTDKTLLKGTRLVQVQLFQKYRLQLEPTNYLSVTDRASHIGSTGE